MPDQNDRTKLAALYRAADDPSPQCLAAASIEIVNAWFERAGVPKTTADDVRLYGAIFEGISRLHPFAAAFVGSEVRRQFFLTTAPEELARQQTGEGRGYRPEEAFARALWLRLADEIDEERGGAREIPLNEIRGRADLEGLSDDALLSVRDRATDRFNEDISGPDAGRWEDLANLADEVYLERWQRRQDRENGEAS